MGEFKTILAIVTNVGVFLIFALYEIIRALVMLVVPAAYEPVKSVKGETILITGAGGGLGRKLAVKLAKKNAKIVIWDIDTKGLRETHELIKDLGGIVHSYKCDLTKREEIYSVAEQVKKDVGDVTILINNAGVVSGYHIWDIPDHLIQRTFDVNAIALFWTAKAFLPKMMENNRGHIVTIASMASHMGVAKLSDYCASKFAAYGFDESLRHDLADLGATGVKTTVICPVFIGSTGMFNDAVTTETRLSPDNVADRIILGIEREDLIVMIPTRMRCIPWLKWIFPWSVMFRAVRELIPDAVPKPGNFVKY